MRSQNKVNAKFKCIFNENKLFTIKCVLHTSITGLHITALNLLFYQMLEVVSLFATGDHVLFAFAPS